MPSEWRVETEKLTASATKIEENTKSYNSEWNKLYTEVENLRSSQWQGIASDAFNKKIEGYKKDFQDMENVLKSYAEYLKKAAKDYEKAENDVKDAANQLYAGK